jgi:hypothetical protein
VAATPDTASAEYMCARLRRLKQTHDLLKGCCSIPPLLLSWQPLSSCTEPLSSAAESRPSQKCEKSSPSTTMSFLTSPRSLCLCFTLSVSVCVSLCLSLSLCRFLALCPSSHSQHKWCCSWVEAVCGLRVQGLGFRIYLPPGACVHACTHKEFASVRGGIPRMPLTRHASVPSLGAVKAFLF